MKVILARKRFQDYVNDCQGNPITISVPISAVLCLNKPVKKTNINKKKIVFIFKLNY